MDAPRARVVLSTRLPPEDQKGVDAAWDAALTPVEKYDRQRWLDTLVGTQAYQAGVDTLTFRSEKAFAGGKVVMEVFYDRAKPGDDRFVVTVLDRQGKQLRQEKYTRTEVEQTAKDLFDHSGNPQPPAVEARWKQIGEMMPKPKEAGK